ncbi:MAG: sulfite exporter TauE/SafE family protein [Planctomycetes bacterium]|nr:sulfite exporter TauE/SafE family protein [Planctomycetota bacterium]
MDVPSFAAIQSPELFWFLAACCALLVGFAKCGISGAGILAVPLMAQIFPAGKSTGILLPMLVAGDILAVVYYKKHAVWGHVLRALPWAICGVIAGWAAIGYIQEAAGGAGIDGYLKKMIGWICLSVLAMGWWVHKKRTEDSLHVPEKWWFAALIGLLGGFMTMAANAAGPIFVIYFLSLQLPKNVFLGTSGWTFLILNSFKLPFSYNLGYITKETLLYDLKMLPAIAAGAILGILLVKKIPEKWFNVTVKILTVAASIKLVLS